MTDETIHSIYNFRRISDDLITAGQPTEDQLRAVAAAGFEVVINLGRLGQDYSLADEAGVVAAAGMEYVHLPVIWEKPTIKDLYAFFDVMEKHQHKRRFVHCAANMRVSTFMGLYQILVLGYPEEQGRQTIANIWEPDDTWAALIQDALAQKKTF